MKGRSDYVLKLEIVKKTIAFAILGITLFYDLTVICCGRVVYSLIAFYLNTYYTKKLMNYGFFTQLKELSPILFMSLLVTALGLLVSYFVTNAFAALIISLIVCPIVYVGLCVVMKVDAFYELLGIIKEKLNGFRKY